MSATDANYNANYELLYAATFGSLLGIEAALKAGADIEYDHVDCDISSTGTALHVACVMGHIDVVKLLLRKGASLVSRTKASYAPLHTAAHEGNTEAVDLLVQHGATVDIRDDSRNTPLMTACVYNHVDTVRRLIELGARPDLTDGYIAQRLTTEDPRWGKFDCSESLKLIEEARKTKLLRCCNPKCGKPGYRKTGTLKLCGRCKLTRYCSRDCQIQHWTVGHKKCCGHDVCSDEGTDPFQKVQSHSTCICHTYDIMERLIAAFTKNL
ncbi:uncharacterized protein LOC144876019 isoform X1 [Branchiostoma floridae x Branchiostoma japonicum]